MRCKNCGTELPGGTANCPYCGSRVQMDDVGQSQNNGAFGQPSYGQQNYGQQNGYNQQPMYSQPNNYGMPIQNMPDLAIYLVIGIVYLLCCCNWIGGIGGIIFTALANSAYKQRDEMGYIRNKKIARLFYIISVVIWVVSIIISFATGLFEGIMSLM